MALGLRYVELEATRRELQAEQQKAATTVQNVLTPSQKIKVSVLQQALLLYPIVPDCLFGDGTKHSSNGSPCANEYYSGEPDRHDRPLRFVFARIAGFELRLWSSRGKLPFHPRSALSGITT
jgi:hypothetical protein